MLQTNAAIRNQKQRLSAQAAKVLHRWQRSGDGSRQDIQGQLREVPALYEEGFSLSGMPWVAKIKIIIIIIIIVIIIIMFIMIMIMIITIILLLRLSLFLL